MTISGNFELMYRRDAGSEGWHEQTLFVGYIFQCFIVTPNKFLPHFIMDR